MSKTVHKIQKGDRVKWPYFRKGIHGERVGFVVGILHAWTARKIKDACDFSLVERNSAGHTVVFAERHCSTVLAIDSISYLVSVRSEWSKWELYRPRQVELCADDDERNGVYPV